MSKPFWKFSNRILFLLCIVIMVVGISAPACADTNVKGPTPRINIWAPSWSSPGGPDNSPLYPRYWFIRHPGSGTGNQMNGQGSGGSGCTGGQGTPASQCTPAFQWAVPSSVGVLPNYVATDRLW